MNKLVPDKFPWIVVALMAAINIGLLGYMVMGENKREIPIPQAREERQKHLITYFQENIGLDQNQSDEFAELWEAFHVKAQAGRQANIHLRDQLHKAIASPDRDQRVVDSLLQITTSKVIAHERIVMEHFDKLFAVCTPEQREKLGEAFTKMMAKGPGMEREGPRSRRPDRRIKK